MGTYEKLLSEFGSVGDGGLAFEDAINEAFADDVTKMLKWEGYDVKGNISIHADFNIPYLWHIVDKTPYQNFTTDFIFNAKTEKIVNKYEEVC